SNMISTVSPTYAKEIQYEYAGYELAPLIRARKDSLLGILNGVDTVRWDPDTDKAIAQTFNAYSVTEKRLENKRNLQYRSSLPIQDDTMLVGVISRLTWQKGFDLAVPAMRSLLEKANVQFVILGTGDPDIEHAIHLLEDDYPDHIRAYLEFDAALSRQIYAGSDLFLMPSHFEPCGMGQMLAMRYGALPLVRETGGLADTVVNYDGGAADGGTGFVFAEESQQAVLGTLEWALETYTERPQAWRRMQRRAMLSDFGWDASARQYRQLYQQAMHKRKEPAQ
ncbi:MAG: glycosyltransferase, partial [Anaerolineae bacterium]|nr:glycosyltransferase [Anaerolineae bacterium]